MTEFREGDLVEAVKGERRVVDRVLKDEEGDLHIRGVGYLTNCFLEEGENPAVDDGYTLTVIERAPQPVPTEPGLYLDVYRNCWSLEETGDWRHAGTTFGRLSAHALPMQKLEPVPETAKRVLERVTDVLSRGGVTSLPNEFGTLAAEFGVQHD